MRVNHDLTGIFDIHLSPPDKSGLLNVGKLENGNKHVYHFCHCQEFMNEKMFSFPNAEGEMLNLFVLPHPKVLSKELKLVHNMRCV